MCVPHSHETRSLDLQSILPYSEHHRKGAPPPVDHRGMGLFSMKIAGTGKVHGPAFFLKSPGREGAGLSTAARRNISLITELTKTHVWFEWEMSPKVRV